MNKTLGLLPYLNVKPLITSIERNCPPGYDLVYDTPSGLAQMLRDRTCHIAAVSSFEALNNSKLVILPQIAIASDGCVSSVLVFSKLPVERIRTLALDTSSLSGAALTKIILKDLFNISPAFISHRPDAEDMLQAADACLLIGNNAMCNTPNVPVTIDLGEAWKRLTGLPMVFGVWAGLSDLVTKEDVEMLHLSKTKGISQIEEIAKEQSEILGLSAGLIKKYLAELMVYDLGVQEMKGLQEFCRRCKQHKLLPDWADVRIYSNSTSPKQSIGTIPR